MLIRIKNNIIFIKNDDLTEFLHVKRCWYLVNNYNDNISFQENLIETKRYICKNFFKNEI